MEITPYKQGVKITAPMVISNMPNETYHAHPDTISNSGLSLIARSPAHYYYREWSEPTRSMQLGTAIHTALLEPDRFDSEYMLLKDVKDRRASEHKEAVKTLGAENVLVSAEADQVIGMRESVLSNPHASNLLSISGDAELSIFAQDPITGVTVRIRPDKLTDCGMMIDLKSTQDARPDEFSRSILNYRYHVQAAFYSDAYKWLTGETLKCFKFLAVESKMPHAVMLYELDETAIMEGRKLYREALNTYAECVESGAWPAYEPTGSEVIGLPEWKVRQLEYELENGGII